ncbi:hypothetical protein EM91_006640 [Vibrio parahaemolyticus]|nr:hypothetical protein EM91_006640 [Vibrio parahaemolyticus]
MQVTANKAFKADSQRLALLVKVSFGVYGAMVWVKWWRCSLLNAALCCFIKFRGFIKWVINCGCHQ